MIAADLDFVKLLCCSFDVRWGKVSPIREAEEMQRVKSIPTNLIAIATLSAETQAVCEQD